jgi:hypothetical protein
MKRISTIACAMALAAAGALAQGTGNAVIVPLAAQNASGETGTVTLTPEGDKTRVTIKLDGTPAGVAQPAHVHEGTCDKIDPKPKYPLPDVKDGASTTTLAVKIESIVDGRHAVNVHKSGSDLKTYVACGTLKRG